ncbi:MAG: 50S ribosomal subunit protein L33 [Candidatus Westeberhardia cardiocondylae]|nr:50S ribosomal subunit protein L33 [Candidatus Westeberhardia cardiocondylae]
MGRINIMLLSSVSSHFYTTTRNKRLKANSIVLRKFDPTVRRYVLYYEKKIKR